MRATIDSAGRIVIPRDIREAAGLEGGAEVDVELSDDGRVTIQAARSKMKIVKRGKLWVAEPEKPVKTMTTKELNAHIRRLRSEREKKIVG